jgi:hypothetical protein
VVIGVQYEDLNSTIRSEFGVVHQGNSGSLQLCRGDSGIVDGEGDVVVASTALQDFNGITCGPAEIMFQYEVDQGFAGLKPAAGEAEGWPRYFLHAQYVDIEAAAAGEVFYDEGDMVEL